MDFLAGIAIGCMVLLPVAAEFVLMVAVACWRGLREGCVEVWEFAKILIWEDR